jgi:hypothetical protein
MLSTQVVAPAASPAAAAGHFEVYCDGFGIFLAGIDGAPDPRKLVLFFHISTFRSNYFGEGTWSSVFVFPDGCVPDGKCQSIADGKVWIDPLDTSETPDAPPKHLTGKYRINLNGKLLEGAFVVKRHDRRRPLRICE